MCSTRTIVLNDPTRSKTQNLKQNEKNSLAFSIVPTEFDAAVTGDDDDDEDEPPEVCILSLDTQQLHIIPPLHRSTGFPPSSTHDMLSPQSNLLPLYQHVWGITVSNVKQTKTKLFKILFLLR